MPSKHDKLYIEKLSPAGHILASEVAKFPFVTYLDDVQLSDGLLSGAIRGTIIIACSDMGWQLPYVCSSSEAPLLLFQDFGHHFTESVVATIVQLEISDVIVYGHSNCEFVKFLATPQQSPEIKDLISKSFSIEHGEQVRNYAQTLEPDYQTALQKVCRCNVLRELKSMIVHPEIANRAFAGRLRLHGWLYTAENNALEIFDPKKKTFATPDVYTWKSVMLNKDNTAEVKWQGSSGREN